MNLIKIVTIYNEELIVLCSNYEDVKKGIDHNFKTNLGSIPVLEAKDFAIIS